MRLKSRLTRQNGPVFLQSLTLSHLLKAIRGYSMAKKRKAINQEVAELRAKFFDGEQRPLFAPRRETKVLTSRNNPIEIDWIQIDMAGKLGVTFVPGKCGNAASFDTIHRRDLDTDLLAIRAEADMLVNMMEAGEREQYLIPDLAARAEALDMPLILHPIPDLSAPTTRAAYVAYQKTAVRLGNMICEGKSVVVTCRGGKGRAGTIAAAVLICLGYESKDAIDLVRQYRKGAIETQTQEQFLGKFQKFIEGKRVVYKYELPKVKKGDTWLPHEDDMTDEEFWAMHGKFHGMTGEKLNDPDFLSDALDR
jgi:hypothetical protein